MKKILLTLSLGLIAFGATAQNVSTRLEAGASFANINSTGLFQFGENKTKVGARVSAAVELGLADLKLVNIYLSPGLTYKMGGTTNEVRVNDILGMYKRPDANSPVLGTSSTTYHSLTLPVTLGARINLFGALGVSAEVGPYISYAVAADTKINNRKFDVFATLKSTAPTLFNTFSNEMKTGIEDKSLFKRFDAGLNASVALEVTRFYVRAGMEYGFVDQFNGDLISEMKKAFNDASELSKDINNSKMTHISLFLTLGVRF